MVLWCTERTAIVLLLACRGGRYADAPKDTSSATQMWVPIGLGSIPLCLVKLFCK